MATRGRKRRQARRAARRENRRLRKQGPDKTYLGGTKEAQEELIGDAGARDADATARADRALDSLKADKAYVRKAEKASEAERQDANALVTQDRAGLQNTLAQNDMNKAADTAIAQNNALAQQRLAQSIQLQNRQAQALASGMGEGGALAMQQAVAQAGQNAGDLAAQNQANQAQLANEMRYAAAQQQAQNALNVSGELLGNSAQGQQLAADRQLQMLGARADAGNNAAQLANQSQGMSQQNNQFMLGGAAGLSQQDNAAAYQNALANSPLNKLGNVLTGIKTVKGITKEGSAAGGLLGIGK